MSSGGVMLTGWLRKSPPENKLKSRHHSWRKRWFVLKSGRLTGDRDVLEYSKNHISKRPIKIIDLNDCKKIEVNVNIPVRGDKKDKDANHHFIFSIVTSHRTFYLIADSIGEMYSWVQPLCDLCGFNYDASYSNDSSKRAFTAPPTGPAVHSTGGSTTASSQTGSESASLLRQDGEKTSVPHYSNTQQRNGAINSSFRHSSNNGYDCTEQDLASARRDYLHNSNISSAVQYHNDVAPFCPPMIIMDPVSTPNITDDTEYLHLANCETLPLIDKSDLRRGSSDSVFYPDDSKSSDDVPDLRPIAPRFVEGGRLDSMPNVPPPAPPVDADILRSMDFDESDVADARRPSKSSLHMFARRVREVEEGVYNVPSQIPSSANARDDTVPWSSTSNSSIGSARQLQSSEYINTQHAHFSSSMSTTSDLMDSPFTGAGAPHSLSSSATGRLMVDHVFPNSPVFPIPHVKQISESSSVPIPKETFSTDDKHILDVRGNIEWRGNGSPEQTPPARPPKKSDLFPRAVTGVDGQGDNSQQKTHSNGHAFPNPVNVICSTSDSTNSESQTLLLPNRTTLTNSTNSPTSSPNMSRWKNGDEKSSIPSNRLASPQEPNMSIYDTPKSLIYDTPKPLKSLAAQNPEKEPNQHVSGVGGANVGLNHDDDSMNLAYPGYEKMAGGGYMGSDVPFDDAGQYTPMTGGISTGPRFPGNSTPLGQLGSMFSDSTNYVPPPVNRDLKPGRKSLGSDGGSTHSGQDLRKSSCRDSYTSDEGLSPPHTTVIQTTQFGEKPLHSMTSSSPVPNGGTLLPWLISQRPARSNVMNLPPSPLVSPNLSQPMRSPVHSSMRNPEKVSSMAPERPPKPASMKYPPLHGNEENRIPPKRPPKPGDNSVLIHNRKHAMPSAVVVPPSPVEDFERDIKYIEIHTPHPQRPNPIRVTDPSHEKNVDKDLVEYAHIDAGKTRALEKMKKERQGKMMQKGNPD